MATLYGAYPGGSRVGVSVGDTPMETLEAEPCGAF